MIFPILPIIGIVTPTMRLCLLIFLCALYFLLTDHLLYELDKKMFSLDGIIFIEYVVFF